MAKKTSTVALNPKHYQNQQYLQNSFLAFDEKEKTL